MDVLDEVVDYLYDGYFSASEIVKSSPDSADVHAPKTFSDSKVKRFKRYKKKRRDTSIGIVNNTFGATAGAYATKLAYDEAKKIKSKPDTKKFPKGDDPNYVGNKKWKIPGTKKTIKYGRALKKLPGGAKTAVLGVGALGVGSQAVNAGMDAWSANFFGKEKLKNKKPKGYDDWKKAGYPGENKKKNKIKKQLDSKLLYEAIIKDINPVFDDGEDVEWSGEFSKVDTEKRQVFGWCSLNKVNGEEIIDRQGDYIPLDEIEKSAYDYVIHSRKGGDMHKRDGDEPLKTSDLIESFVVTPEKLEQLGLEQDAVPHGWWVGFKVNDDDQWEAVKKGDRRHFSIHGKGRRVEKSM